jgi:hypothetical protein
VRDGRRASQRNAGVAHQGSEPSRCDGGLDPGLQVARIEVYAVPFVAAPDNFLPLKADARAIIGENEARAAIAFEEITLRAGKRVCGK